MPNVKIIPVFQFGELSDRAKERARDGWRASGLDYEWWDSVFDWHAEVCTALGIDLDAKKRYFDLGRSGNGSSYCGTVRAFALLTALESNALASVSPTLELPTAPVLHRLVRELLENRDVNIVASCGASRGYAGEFTLHTEHDIDCYDLDGALPPRVTAELVALGEWAESVLDAIIVATPTVSATRLPKRPRPKARATYTSATMA